MTAEDASASLLAWVRANLSEFSLTHAANPDESFRLIKPIGELALCCDILIRSDVRPTLARDVLNWTWNDLDSGLVLEQMLLARPDLVILSSLYQTYHSNSLSRPSLHQLLAHLSAASSTRALQLPYWRRLDLERSARLLGIAVEPPNVHRTWAWHEPEPWTLELDSAYALTHEVFYLTDFGQEPQAMPLSTREYVARWCHVWREIYARRGNWDIYAELLMVSACLRIPVQSGEFSRMTSSIRPEGYLEGPREGGRLLIQESMAEARKVFLTNYHTTLVGLMALALNSAFGSTPSRHS